MPPPGPRTPRARPAGDVTLLVVPFPRTNFTGSERKGTGGSPVALYGKVLYSSVLNSRLDSEEIRTRENHGIDIHFRAHGGARGAGTADAARIVPSRAAFRHRALPSPRSPAFRLAQRCRGVSLGVLGDPGERAGGDRRRSRGLAISPLRKDGHRPPGAPQRTGGAGGRRVAAVRPDGGRLRVSATARAALAGPRRGAVHCDDDLLRRVRLSPQALRPLRDIAAPPARVWQWHCLAGVGALVLRARGGPCLSASGPGTCCGGPVPCMTRPRATWPKQPAAPGAGGSRPGAAGWRGPSDGCAGARPRTCRAG